MLIFTVRHGQTDWNLQERFQGRTDIPLNQTGMAQARQAGEILAPFAPIRVVSSPLIRARATGRIIAEACGIAWMDVDERLIERDMGSYEGEAIASKPDYFRRWDANDGSMEPLSQVRDRMRQALCAMQDSGGNVVAVSHGGAINGLLYEVSQGKVGTGVTRLVNGSVSVFSFHQGELTLLACNLLPMELKDWGSKHGYPSGAKAKR